MKPSLADSPARSTSLAKPAVVNGAPRSDVKSLKAKGNQIEKRRGGAP